MEAEYEQMKARVMDALKKDIPSRIHQPPRRHHGLPQLDQGGRSPKSSSWELRTLRMQLAEQDMKLELTSTARYAIADAGYNPDYGARPLRRVIQSEVQDPLSEALLEGRFVPGDTIQVDFVPDDPAGVTKQGVVGEQTSSARNPFDAANGKADDEGPRGRYEFTAIAHEEVQEPEDSETTEALEALLQ